MKNGLRSVFKAARDNVKAILNSRQVEEERLEAMVGPPGVWRESSDFQITFLKQRGLRPKHSILDIGCGPLRGGVPLIKYLNSGSYVGIDVRREVVEEAWVRIRKLGLESKRPQVLSSESFGKEELGERRFDYIWCFQVLYHLDDALVECCFGRIGEALGENGVCFANINTVSTEGRWLEFPYKPRPLEFYAGVAEKNSLTVRDIGEQRELGYTTKVPGQYDRMLEITRQADATGRFGGRKSSDVILA